MNFLLPASISLFLNHLLPLRSSRLSPSVECQSESLKCMYLRARPQRQRGRAHRRRTGPPARARETRRSARGGRQASAASLTF